MGDKLSSTCGCFSERAIYLRHEFYFRCGWLEDEADKTNAINKISKNLFPHKIVFINMENTGMNGLEWSQTANIAYRVLGLDDQKNIDHILSALAPDVLIAEARSLKDDVFVFRVPPFLRLVLKREGSRIQLMDIVDKRVADAIWGKKVS